MGKKGGQTRVFYKFSYFLGLPIDFIFYFFLKLFFSLDKETFNKTGSAGSIFLFLQFVILSRF